jgi:hypothetical protein
VRRKKRDDRTRLRVEDLESREYLSVVQFVDSTSADFAAGTLAPNTYLADTTNGELTLAPTAAAEFSGGSLPDGWSTGRLSRRGVSTVAGGVLTLNRAAALTEAQFQPGQSLEFVATFGTDSTQRVGFGSTSRRGPWAGFGVGNKGVLQAITSNGRTTIATPIAGVPLGSAHLYGIQWETSQVNFSIDGIRVASHALAITVAMNIVATDAASRSPMSVDWMRLASYAGTGTYLSRVLGDEAPLRWGAIAWAGDVPNGASLTMSVRTGDTPTPDDGTWSDFAPVAASNTVIGVASRYLQYRAVLATTQSTATPTLEAVTIEANGSVAVVGLDAGWATFGQVVPQGEAMDALRIGELQTQTDVKTRWPDGSIRYAIVSAAIPAAGFYAISDAPASSGLFAPEVADANVRFDIGGVVYTAALGNAASDDHWLSGPLVREWRTVVAPRDAQGGEHPFLRVIFDARTYVDGQTRLDVAVENTLDVAGATAAVYDVDVISAGQTLFAQDGVEHWYLTRWRKVFGLGLDGSAVTPDFRAAYRAAALPRYLSIVENTVSSMDGPEFGILQSGHLEKQMPAHGGRPEIAPYPDWTARYLAHRNPQQGQYVLANGDLAGSWPVHVREADGRLISIDERPNFWLDYRAEDGNKPRGDLAAAGPLTPDIAHQPSLAYVPYLVTGDRYYADEMRFWANYVLIRTYQDDYNYRRGAEGWLGGNEVRGIAWGLRNLVDAAAYLPDGDSVKDYLAQKVTNNLRGLDEMAAAAGSPLGTLWEDKRPENQFAAPKVWISTWEQNYLAWAIDHANEQGFAGGAVHRDRIADFQLQLFASPDFDRRYAGLGVIAVGVQAGGSVRLYSSMAELFRNNVAASDPPTPFAGYYGVDARLALLISIDNSRPGAQDAYDYLYSQIAVDPAGPSDLANRAGWAIAADGER